MPTGESGARARAALTAIEAIVVTYGLELSQGKREVVVTGKPGAGFRYGDDAGMAQPPAAKYLGCDTCLLIFRQGTGQEAR